MNDGSPVQDGATQPANGEDVLPLFYSQPEILRKELHAELGLSGEAKFDFARTANAIPVTVSEFASAGLHYPIIFVGANSTPVAVTSVRQGDNLFVGEDGVWDQLSYMPAYVRRYPFVFVRDPKEERYALCIDRASDRVVPAGGDDVRALFDGDDMSDLTKQALDFCTAYQQEAMQTERFAAMLKEHDLVVERSLNLTLRDGNKIAINNVGIIDEQKLQGLDKEAFISLRDNGALGAIYCHLMSQKAWQPLVARVS